ncbi:MAG: tRNA (N(6)-L-threonylcarbamoyladenosine(37)-C(2))-methylthiotransferase MtaB [Alphaproteobacteria bacterium]|nr:MAG: tRNA (N(6)-L-threonylcarbamoyladenosine(37)-C(2))-methylthiotransferase MtaB [Alphaproteobacteria bacterium]
MPHDSNDEMIELPDPEAQLAQQGKEGPRVITFGCRLNIYESEVMKDHAVKAGLNDAIIVNTCAVTSEAERQARQAIRRARRENPDAKIIVTGCAAQVNPKSFSDMPEVNQVIGNDLKLKAETWSQPATERVVVNDIMSVKETARHMISGFESHARAFVQVQNGCDHRCTFCIIPFGRGNSRSVPMGEIAEQVKKLVSGGYNEVVLTGVDITSYGPDLPGQPTLGQMIRRLLALVPDLKRLRLSSLDPVEIDEDLWKIIADEPRFMPHLHLSMQAGDDMILKRMKRRHLRHHLMEVCDRARKLRPDVVFGADIIAGFPTETDEMFDNTLKAVTECDLTFLHVFPYSPRPGTPAARMPQVDGGIRKARAKALRDVGAKQLERHLSTLVGKTLPVLVEKGNKGRTEYFSEVAVNSDVKIGSLVKVTMQAAEDGCLKGVIAA